MPNSISQSACSWLCACVSEHLPFAQLHVIQKMLTVNLSDLGHTLLGDAPFFRRLMKFKYIGDFSVVCVNLTYSDINLEQIPVLKT